MDYQSEGTKLIYLYNRGTYGGTEVRTIEVRTEVRTEVRAYSMMTYGRLPMRAGRASSEQQRVVSSGDIESIGDIVFDDIVFESNRLTLRK